MLRKTRFKPKNKGYISLITLIIKIGKNFFIKDDLV